MQTSQPFPSVGIAILLTVAVVALQVALSLPIEAVAWVYALATHQTPMHPAQHPLVLGIINLLAFGAVIGWGVRMARAPAREVVALRPVRALLVLPVLLGVAGSAVVLSEVDNVFRWVVPIPQALADLFRKLVSEEAGWQYSLILVVVVAPLTEEVLFRGLILGGLLGRHRVRDAVWISAGLFAVVHMNPWQFLSAGLLGLLFGWWFYRTHSLLPGLLGHALINGLFLGCRYLPWEISGFNKGEGYPQGEFQPLWFNLAGVAMLGMGLWLFHRWSPKPSPPSPAPFAGPPPPVISLTSTNG